MFVCVWINMWRSAKHIACVWNISHNSYKSVRMRENRRCGSNLLFVCACARHTARQICLFVFLLIFIYYSDNRLNHLPFMENPISMVLLISTYLYVIRNGKKFMEPQKPYNIHKIIIVYNILQIITNLGLFLVVSVPPTISQMAIEMSCYFFFQQQQWNIHFSFFPEFG